MLLKVVTAKSMAAVEQSAYAKGYSEAAFMHQAGQGIADYVAAYIQKHALPKRVLLVCGKGNNAGDAYVAGTDLLRLHQCKVVAIQAFSLEDCSPLCQHNLRAFQAAGGVIRSFASDLSEPFSEAGLVIDGLFGTGFKGTVPESLAVLIQKANTSKKPILAVDIPSGLNGDTGSVEGEAIFATETLFLGLPKTGFFLRDGWNHVGTLRYIDFDLPSSSIEEVEEDFRLLDMQDIAPFLPHHKRNAHKYERGYVVGLAGSPGMPGAAILSGLSALVSGAGIVRLLHPKGMESEFSLSPYELIHEAVSFDQVETILETMEKGSSVFLGPGLGRSPETAKLLQKLLPGITKPCVIDADALNLIAKEQLSFPKRSILTPHKGEMDRLLFLSDAPPLDCDYLQVCKRYAAKHEATVVLKGGPTFIIPASGVILVCPVGDPGMATAGSGDVLTGVVASMLAQGLSPIEATKFAVFLHGLAGESAANQKTSRTMIASDLIDHFSDAYHMIENFLRR